MPTAARRRGQPEQEQYTANGDPSATVDADANAGVASHKASAGSCTGFTTCTSYDSVYGTLPTTSTNALNQSTTTNYTTTAADGFGLWPSSRTDANGQTTSLSYDALGRTLSTTLPGETAGETTTSLAYTVACHLTGADSPCLEVDTTQRLDASTTVLKRDFYDGEGQHVESRTAAPGGQDVVQYALYDNEGRAYFQSQPYFVTAYTGVAGKAAYSLPDVTKVGTTTTYDALGRVTISTDANEATTTTSYSMACAPAGTNGDQACYSSTTTIDANGHKSLGYTDALGRGIYDQSFTGTSSGTLYRTTTTHYDVLGHVVETDYADGTHKATATYDGLQHETTFTDPDLGTYNLGYDPNGNLVWSIDPRGTSGTLHLGYDGLNRLGWQSTHGDGSSPLAGYYYDNTTYGGSGVGRLTSESFASGPNQSVTGAYYYGYDARGQRINEDMVLGTDHYLTFGYNDAGQQTTLGYPDGDVVTTSYGAQDWLSGVTEAKSGTSNTLLNTLSYTGANGASMLPTSATVDNGVYSWNLSYDTDLRLKETKVQQVSTSSTLFDQTRAFDAVGNVTTTATTLPAGTDTQVFCYDEQNRLVWAGSQGTPSCGGTLTPGTLNTGNVRYTQTNSYDVLDRLTTGPLGSGYTYGDTTHLDAVTTAPTYSASYDAAGSMTGRNGQVLGYDALRRLITWQNQATSPTQTASYAYNGSGERVQQVVTSGGATTTTSYIAGIEDISVTGGTTTTTKYYSAGLATVANTNGTLSYLVNDDLGSVSAALTAAGGVQATALYTPYGSVRYSSGTMPTSYGYTKQRQDPSGLNYDHARYYDANVGQFISADAKQGPNRYGYVAGNPETMTDPTGNNVGRVCPDSNCEPGGKYNPPGTGGGGGGGGSAGNSSGNGGSSKPSGNTCNKVCQENKNSSGGGSSPTEQFQLFLIQHGVPIKDLAALVKIFMNLSGGDGNFGTEMSFCLNHCTSGDDDVILGFRYDFKQATDEMAHLNTDSSNLATFAAWLGALGAIGGFAGALAALQSAASIPIVGPALVGIGAATLVAIFAGAVAIAAVLGAYALTLSNTATRLGDTFSQQNNAGFVYEDPDLFFWPGFYNENQVNCFPPGSNKCKE